MDTDTMDTATDLTTLVLHFRDTTGLPLTRLAKRADLSTGTVSNVANAKPGQRFDEDTEHKIRNAIAQYIVDVSALAGDLGETDTDDELDAAIERVRRRR